MKACELHEEAIKRTKNYQQCEGALLEILIEIESRKAFVELGYPSLHVYCTQALNLSDAHAYALIAVARKSLVVPEMKELIRSGQMHLSNARRIVSVVTADNKQQWLPKAIALSQRELEREVVKANPQAVPKTRIRSVTEDAVEIKVSVTREVEEKLRRAMDVLAQKRQKHIALPELLNEILEEFLNRNDPVKKAERCLPRQNAEREEPHPSTWKHKDEGGERVLCPRKKQTGVGRDHGKIEEDDPGEKNPHLFGRSESQSPLR